MLSLKVFGEDFVYLLSSNECKERNEKKEIRKEKQ